MDRAGAVELLLGRMIHLHRSQTKQAIRGIRVVVGLTIPGFRQLMTTRSGRGRGGPDDSED